VSAGVKDDKEILRLITDASLEDLRKMLKGTSAGPFLADGNEKTFGCVRTVLSSGVRALKYTTRQEGTPFSVREWVRTGAARHAGGKGGVLFLPYQAGEIAALRSMISAWLRIAIFEAMSKGEGDQRLWFVIDELDALGEIDGLKDALARMRKFGGRCVLGLQSIAQIPALYRKDAPTITENCGNTVILRCSASEHGGTADFASKLIGQREVIHITRSQTRRTPWSLIRPTTTSESIRIEPAVMASEIERLPDLEGFLKFASNPDWQHVTLPPSNGAAAARGKRPTATAPSSPPPTAVPAPASAAALSQPVGAAPLSPTPRRPTKPTKRTPRKRTRKPRTQVTPPSPDLARPISGDPSPTTR
jgi:type IV secretory pathway TraG/TraD family ATPase VirD4